MDTARKLELLKEKIERQFESFRRFQAVLHKPVTQSDDFTKLLVFMLENGMFGDEHGKKRLWL